MQRPFQPSKDCVPVFRLAPSDLLRIPLLTMSPIVRMFSTKERRSSVPEYNDDLENGPTRLSMLRESQSVPQSFPQTYQEAMDTVERSGTTSPQSLKDKSRDPYIMPPSPPLPLLPDKAYVPYGTPDQYPNTRAAFEQKGTYNAQVTHTARNAHRPIPSTSLAPRPAPKELDEYAWSPRQSEDGGDVIIDLPQAHSTRLVSNTDLSWLAKSDNGQEDDEAPLSSSTAASANIGMTEPTLPVINLTVPGATFDLQTQRLSRLSGIISDGMSQRAMSDAELRSSLSSIGDIIRSNLRRDESSSSQMGPLATFGDDEANYLHQTPSIDDPGPGTLQSSSSENTGKRRSPTPPLLFGRDAIDNTENSQPSRSNSRLGEVLRAHGIKKDGRLGRAYPMSSGEHDWETVSDVREFGFHVASEDATDTQTGSSLADNSDSGDISLPKHEISDAHSGGFQPSSRPRLNQSYMIIKDHATGQSYSIPQLENEPRDQTPSAPVDNQSRAYHHPTPLFEDHTHPFISSPPVIVPPQRVADSQMDHSSPDQTVPEPSYVSSEFSHDEQKLKQQRKSIYELTTPASKGSKGEMNETQRGFDSKERSHHSSTWVSTLSEDDSVASALPQLPGRQSSFAKVTILGAKGNITGSPDGTGAREVGSSLADASSPGAPLSSSPAPFMATPYSQHQTQSNANSPQTLASRRSSTPKSTGSAAVPLKTGGIQMPKNKEQWLQAIPPRKQQDLGELPPARRRRSSSESESSGMPTSRKSSVMHAPERSNTSAGLSRQAASSSQYEDSIQGSDHPYLRERHAHQATPDTLSSMSSESRPLRTLSGLVVTDVPAPAFDHPAYGCDRLWESSKHPAYSDVTPFGRGRNRNRDIVIRPVARIDSPHLYRVPHTITAELLERHRLISTVYLVICCCMPVMALAYGYGLLDWIINAHMHGEIEGWKPRHVIFARVWAPFVTVGYIVTIGVVWGVSLA